MVQTVLIMGGLISLGLLLGIFGIWTIGIGRSMTVTGSRTRAIKDLTSLTDWLKAMIVTIPFAFLSFQVLCHVENMRQSESVSNRSKEVYGLAWAFLITAIATVAAAFVF